MCQQLEEAVNCPKAEGSSAVIAQADRGRNLTPLEILTGSTPLNCKKRRKYT